MSLKIWTIRKLRPNPAITCTTGTVGAGLQQCPTFHVMDGVTWMHMLHSPCPKLCHQTQRKLNGTKCFCLGLLLKGILWIGKNSVWSFKQPADTELFNPLSPAAFILASPRHICSTVHHETLSVHSALPIPKVSLCPHKLW